MQGAPPHNKDHEAKAKKVEPRRGRRKTRRGTRTELVQGEPRGAGRKVKEFRSIYDFLEEEKERQICKASASSFGSSPCPNARIAATTSSSRFRARISRSAPSRCFRSFSASASRGRRLRLFSSAMTSRISFSIGSSGMDLVDTIAALYRLGNDAWQTAETTIDPRKPAPLYLFLRAGTAVGSSVPRVIPRAAVGG